MPCPACACNYLIKSHFCDWPQTIGVKAERQLSRRVEWGRFARGSFVEGGDALCKELDLAEGDEQPTPSGSGSKPSTIAVPK